MTTWHPAADPPTIYETVLINARGIVTPFVWLGYFVDDGTWYAVDDTAADVTHWAELPDCPHETALETTVRQVVKNQDDGFDVLASASWDEVRRIVKGDAEG